MVARADGVVLFIERLALRGENDVCRFAEVLHRAWRDAASLRDRSSPVCVSDGNTRMSVIIENCEVTLIVGYLRLSVPEAIGTLIATLERARHAARGINALGAHP